ncbi:MAG: Rne/Rng family ribonuclease [Deltaproteobacteria bacterium]|nr:Rne/Rng family ribonuclease [Deltaproteobacteria bacterium]
MDTKILINAIDPEECRVAKVADGLLEEFNIETAAKKITQGNIYKGTIVRIEPSLQAAFIEYGDERHGFLQLEEIHQDYFANAESREKTIDKLLKPGQEIIVQIVKDRIMKKGAALTTFVSLAGRYTVLMPGSANRAISRKIESEKERERLKNIINNIKLPKDFGIIIRTASINCTKTKINEDVRYLMRIWRGIKAGIKKKKTPCLLYEESNVALRAIRDSFTDDVSEILIDNPVIFDEIKIFINLISPKHNKIVKLYAGLKPIFTKYQLEDQIASVYRNLVKLKSGGSIVIGQTEALVAIDVNSGKATRKHSVEETAAQTNLEAAQEIAKQLRIRDLGGLIVIDFIDMREKKNKSALEKEMKKCLKKDKAKTKVGNISMFGLMEMSRQRIRPSIEFGSLETCKHCNGKGLVSSKETLGLSFLRRLNLDTLKKRSGVVKCILPKKTAEYLLNKKRKDIIELEDIRNISISIECDDTMNCSDSKIIYEELNDVE